MNIAMTLKRMPTVDMQISDLVPHAGEIIMDATSCNVKIGDGTTAIKDLPWAHFSVDLSTEPSCNYKMSDSIKRFIEQHIDLIEECRFDEVYDIISYYSVEFTRDFTRALLLSDINPKPYLTTVPTRIQDLLLDLPPYDKVDNLNNKIYMHNYDDWSLDKTRLYANPLSSQLTFEEINRQLFGAWGIPKSMITIKGED